MKVVFVAGFGPIVCEQQASEAFYAGTLGLSFERDGEYLHTEQLAGVKTFALWPLLNVNEKFALARITTAAPSYSVSPPPSPCCRSFAALAR